MADQAIYGALGKIFENVLGTAVSLSETTSTQDIEGWDSLRHIQILMAVERRFKIKFSAAEIGGIKNVGALVALIQKKVK